MKKYLKTNKILLGCVALSSVAAISVPIVLSSCSAGYTFSWASQVTSSITPYQPKDDNDIYNMSTHDAMKLWYNGLKKDKLRTLDLVSGALSILPILGNFVNLNSGTSPISISVKKSTFDFKENFSIKDIQTGGIIHNNNAVLWTTDLKLNINLPTEVYQFKSIEFKLNKFPIFASIFNNVSPETLQGLQETMGLELPGRYVNTFEPYNWNWSSIDDVYNADTTMNTFTDAVGAGKGDIIIHPFSGPKYAYKDLPASLLYSLYVKIAWDIADPGYDTGGSGILPLLLSSYYLSNIMLSTNSNN